jgi:hypothetical protein
VDEIAKKLDVKTSGRAETFKQYTPPEMVLEKIAEQEKKQEDKAS